MSKRFVTLLVFIFFVGLPVSAHEDAHVSYQDLGGEPRITSSHPLYILKEVQRAIRQTFALGTQKADVDIAIALERLAEIKKLAEEDEPKTRESLLSAEERYRAHFETLRERFESLADANPNAEMLMQKFGELAERHILVFQEVRERIGERKEEEKKTETTFIETVRAVLEDHPGKAEAVIGKVFKSGKKKFETVREILQELESLYKEKIGSSPPDGDEQFACIQVYDPVCGADGITYSNSCFAGLAKVGIAHLGACN